jgi:hypothetical protein
MVSPPERVRAPTAVHDAEELHETPVSTMVSESLRFGVFWIDQSLPFHLSTKGD